MNGSDVLRVGLIGWPISHSLSPILHQAAFQQQNLPWRYELVPIHPEHLEGEIAVLREESWIGFNVTAPYKQTILHYLDSCSPEAQQLHSVNTILCTPEGCWHGENTDGIALQTLLTEMQREAKLLRQVTLFGSGGVASSVICALVAIGVTHTTILSRNTTQALTLLEQVSMQCGTGMEISVSLFRDAAVQHALYTSDLIINATPVGMAYQSTVTFFSEQIFIPSSTRFFDLVYQPRETTMMRQVREAGGIAWNGMEMLIRQAAAAFTLWSGREAPMQTMRQALQGESR